MPESEPGHILDDAGVLKRATVRYHARKGNTG
jgi:hypothetical protein